jgi:hypothetical protein
MCKIVPFAATLSVNVSIFTLIAISIDRYHVVIYPLKKKLGILQCKVILIMIWLIACLFSVVKLINFRTENDPVSQVLICEPNNILLNKIETYFLIIVQYMAPCVLILYIYIRIGFKVLFQQSNAVNSNSRGTLRRKERVSLH